MKVLITNFRLAEPTASERFVRDLARLLRAGGAEVAVFASRLGALAEELRLEGIAVADQPRVDSFKPDLIQGQGNLEAMAALLAHPGVPAVFLSRGGGPWREQPPRHPRIGRYLGCTRATRDWLVRHWRLPPERVAALPELVDESALGEPRRVPERPGTALYCDYLPAVDGEERFLRRACAELGIRFETISGLAGKTALRAEGLVARYDLVFASGQTVLVALAAGCGVVPVSQGSFGDLVTVENFERAAAADFAPRRPVRAESVMAAELVTELETWDWRLLGPLAAKVRVRHGGEAVRGRLLEIFEAVLAEAADRRTNSRGELPAVAEWLLELAGEHHQLDAGYLELQHRSSLLRRDRQRLDGELQALACELQREREKVRLARRLLQDGSVFHQRLRQRIEDGWRELEEAGQVPWSQAGGAIRKPPVDLSG